jgi:regulator of protease activity HflC (stomatin/prohibitin superfamily)
MDDDLRSIVSIGLGTFSLLTATIGGAMYGCPQYNVYSSRLSGQAKLAEAQSSRMAKVVEAKARLESARYDADAEIARAKGTKEANNIVISSFGSTDERLRYLQIEAMRDGMKAGTVIYVPTEGGLPVTEAGKR